MGLFTNFTIDGFTSAEKNFYSPGTLYEVMCKLGDNLKAEEIRSKTRTMLDAWYVPADSFRAQGNQVPAYALEMHAVNEANNEHNGYGTFVFIPDGLQKSVILPLKSLYSPPLEIEDDEDQVKVLSALYSDANGYSTNESLSILELSCVNEEFYPINIWSKEFANDPIEEIFGVFDALKPGEFAGLQIIVVPPERDFDLAARKRIRFIEDEDYEEQIGIIETFRRIVSNEDLPDEEVERLAGYKKQQLDPQEKEEIEAIRQKVANRSVFRCTFRVYGSSMEVAKDLADIITRRTSGKWNSLEIVDADCKLVDLAIRREGRCPFLMSDDEICSIWHVASEDTMGDRRHHPLPAALTPPDELIAINPGEAGDIQALLHTINIR